MWQIQQSRLTRWGRAVWHLHAVIDVRLDVNWLRDWLGNRGWGRMMRVDEVGCPSNWDEGKDFEKWQRGVIKRVARYVSRYMTRESPCGENERAGKRPVAWWVGKVKCGTVTFAWAGGLAKLYRLGIGLYLQSESLPWWRYLQRVREAVLAGRGRVFREMILRLGLEEVWGDARFETCAVQLGLAPPRV